MAKRKASSSSRKSRTRKPRIFSAWTLLGFVLMLAVGFLVREGYIELPEDLELPAGIEIPGLETAATPAPREVSGGSIQVFFTTPWLVYPDVPEQRTPPPFEQTLIADIDAAQASVDVATFDYNLMSVAEALVRAQQRGVRVRLALDRENLEKPEMARWAGQLEGAGIPIAWEETNAFQHSKFVIVDGGLVWTGSWNISENGTYRNNNNVLRLAVPALAENYTAEFEQMFGGEFGRGKQSLSPNPVIQLDTIPIENYFSPQDGIAEHIVAEVQQAERRIRFLAFSYTSDPIAEAMLERYEAGVPVQGVFENRNAGGIGAEYDRLKEAGADVWEDGNCYTMHHKVIIVDDETVITGSYNFSARAEDTNDENVVIFTDPVLAGHFVEEFQRVYAQAQQPTRCGR